MAGRIGSLLIWKHIDPADTHRNNDVVITSRRRHFHVMALLWLYGVYEWVAIGLSPLRRQALPEPNMYIRSK